MGAPDNTRTSICNQALAHIKQRTIASLTEQSEQARKCALFYDSSRRATLRSCDWNFATVHQQLAELGNVNAAQANPTIPSFQDIFPQWNYLYAYPAKCARFRKIYNPQRPVMPDPYRDRTMGERWSERWAEVQEFKIGRSPITNVLAIAANMEAAWGEFTFDVQDESQFDDMFIEGFAWKLATELALPLTADKELLALCEQKFEQEMGEAKRKNGGEGTERGPRHSAYESVRDY